MGPLSNRSSETHEGAVIMNIVVAGGTGFIGQYLTQVLVEEGHRVTVLSRCPEKASLPLSSNFCALKWNGRTVEDWAKRCEGTDAVINLTGAPIADSRWTRKRKHVLIESRVESTRTLLQAIQSWNPKPHTFLSASGIGFYGDRQAEVVDESSTTGHGFLPQLCQAWEGAAHQGEAMGLRVIVMRIGMVLESDGGALSKMTIPFRFFLGGPILPGTQFVSWIHREDLVRLILFALTHSAIRGPVNAVAPESVTMQDFCAALGKAIKRPSWCPVPRFALNIALGELSTLLTTGQRVYPRKALLEGFAFAYPTLQRAFQAIWRHSPSPLMNRAHTERI